MAEIVEIQTQNTLANVQSFEAIEKNAEFQIIPCEGDLALDDPTRYAKLPLSTGQKMQMSALLQQMPQAMAAGTLAGAYTVRFPAGLPHTLTALRQGGYGSMISSGGEFVGSASFYPVAAQAAALGAFTAMSAVTGQYFLSQINSELKIVNQKLDAILDFLYGEKKAELMAEISFVKYAHSNFSSIMMHDDQRAATIASLQAARKVAMKDIEFYMTDLDSTAAHKAKDYADLCNYAEKAMRIKDSIEMSRQLYIVSCLLELYFSQNYEESYIDFMKANMEAYIQKSDTRILSGLSKFQTKFADYKAKPLEKLDGKEAFLEKLEIAVDPYKDGNASPVKVAMQGSLEALHKKAEYYIDSTGNMYTKRTA